MRRSPERRISLALTLLCLTAWLSGGWHLAVESHDHDHARVAHDHHGRGHGHDHDAPAPEGHDPHDAGDHVFPDSTRPSPAPSLPWTIPSRWASPRRERLELAPEPAPPRADDIAPDSDPPARSRRPRAPPVG